MGSPDDVVEQLEQLYEDLGGFGVLLAMGHEWEPKELWLNSMKAVEGRGLAQTVVQLNGLEQLNQERVPPFYAEETI